MSGTRESSTETDYKFGYTNELELQNQESALSTVKRLRQRFVVSISEIKHFRLFRIQRQQSGQSGIEIIVVFQATTMFRPALYGRIQ
jgi:hypothetical protein